MQAGEAEHRKVKMAGLKDQVLQNKLFKVAVLLSRTVMAEPKGHIMKIVAGEALITAVDRKKEGTSFKQQIATVMEKVMVTCELVKAAAGAMARLTGANSIGYMETGHDMLLDKTSALNRLVEQQCPVKINDHGAHRIAVTNIQYTLHTALIINCQILNKITRIFALNKVSLDIRISQN